MTDEKTPQTCPSCGQPTWDNGVLMFHLNAAHDDSCPAASRSNR